MALRLSRDIKREAPTTGFDLNFTVGLTYNLDELFALRNRGDSSTKLVLNVKRDSEIKSIVDERFKAEVDETLKQVFSSEEIKAKAFEIIETSLNNLKLDLNKLSLYPDAKKQIENKLNAYYKNILGYEIKVSFSIENGKLATISCYYADKSKLSNKYNQIYDEVLSELASKDSEGSLSISDKKIKLNLSPSDYQKYLLNNNCSSSSQSSNSIKISKSSNVLWTDATDDNTTEDQVKTSLYDELENLQETVNALDKKLANTNSCDCEFVITENSDGTFDLGNSMGTNLEENPDGGFNIL